MLRILIADDHDLILKGLKQILKEAFPSALIEEVKNAEGVFKKAIQQEWDIVISDISMPGRGGLDMLHDLKESFPKMPVLILSVHPEEQYAMRVLRAGAAGYLSKGSANDELVKAVQHILLGRKYISPYMAEKLAEQIDVPLSKPLHTILSDKEFHIFKLIAEGKSIVEIAAMLSVSQTTISTHKAKLLTKMQMRANAELTRYAIENKLI